jgi:hypothetical protein
LSSGSRGWAKTQAMAAAGSCFAQARSGVRSLWKPSPLFQSSGAKARRVPAGFCLERVPMIEVRAASRNSGSRERARARARSGFRAARAARARGASWRASLGSGRALAQVAAAAGSRAVQASRASRASSGAKFSVREAAQRVEAVASWLVQAVKAMRRRARAGSSSVRARESSRRGKDSAGRRRTRARRVEARVAKAGGAPEGERWACQAAMAAAAVSAARTGGVGVSRQDQAGRETGAAGGSAAGRAEEGELERRTAQVAAAPRARPRERAGRVERARDLFTGRIRRG